MPHLIAAAASTENQKSVRPFSGEILFRLPLTPLLVLEVGVVLLTGF